jgi:hypothetical protein
MAEMQQQWANEILQTQAERQQYIETLGQVVNNSMAGLEQFANVDWDSLKESDPIAFVTKRDELREAQDRVQSMQNEQGMAQQQQFEELQRMKGMAIKEEQQRLLEIVPEMADATKRKEIASSMTSYALEQGFSQEELKELVDHRHFLVLMKAQKYDALQNSDIKSKKLKNKPKVIRAGKGTNKKSDTAKAKRAASMKRLKESGHVDDSVALFEDFVEL